MRKPAHTQILLLIVPLFIPLFASAQNRWKSYKDIPKKWIKVERDSLGYLIYHPCDGRTPMMALSDKTITIFDQLEDPVSYSIINFSEQVKGKPVAIRAKNAFEQVAFTLDLKDEKRSLLLFAFKNVKWLMVPESSKNRFRHIENSCPAGKIPEITFLPVEF